MVYLCTEHSKWHCDAGITVAVLLFATIDKNKFKLFYNCFQMICSCVCACESNEPIDSLSNGWAQKICHLTSFQMTKMTNYRSFPRPFFFFVVAYFFRFFCC